MDARFARSFDQRVHDGQARRDLIGQEAPGGQLGQASRNDVVDPWLPDRFTQPLR
jgi:hypothetical protein